MNIKINTLAILCHTALASLLAGCVSIPSLPESSESKQNTTNSNANNQISEKKGPDPMAFLSTNKLGTREEKITFARSAYMEFYPDAKPVEFLGKKGNELKIRMESMKKYTTGSGAKLIEGSIQNLSSYYEDVQADINKLVSDENYSYLFNHYENGKILASMQVDLKNIENIRSMIREKKGVLEPILYFDGYFKLNIDIESTKKLHAKLSKLLALKPLSDTLAVGGVIAKRINDEISRRSALSQDKVDRELNKKYTVTSIFSEISKIKESATVETEYQPIYNIRFKEIFSHPIFNDVSYIVILNKDNMLVDRFPNFVTQKIYTEKYIKERAPQVSMTSGKREVYMAYKAYKNSVESSIKSMVNGNQYSNTSIQIFSIDRFKTLENTGLKLIPDLKITATNISKLDDLLVDSRFYGLTGDSNECFSVFTTIEEGCWNNALKTYEHLWDPLINAETKEKIDKARISSMNQYDVVFSHLIKSKDALKITGATSSKRLK